MGGGVVASAFATQLRYLIVLSGHLADDPGYTGSRLLVPDQFGILLLQNNEKLILLLQFSAVTNRRLSFGSVKAF